MVFIGPLITVGVLALALAYGGRAEREAAWVVLAALAFSIGLAAVLGLDHQLPIALADLVLAAGLVFLAVRHRRAWLYAEAVLALALTITQLVSLQLLELSLTYRLVVDGINLIALAILACAVVAHGARVRRALGYQRPARSPNRPLA